MRTLAASAAILVLSFSPLQAGPKEDAYVTIEKWAAGLNAFNADEVTSHYLPDAVVHSTLGRNLTTGADAIRAYFAGVARAKFQVKMQDWTAVELSPDAVAIAGFYEFTGARADGQPWIIPARYSFDVVKRDGAWRIAHHHSSPRPAPPQQ